MPCEHPQNSIALDTITSVTRCTVCGTRFDCSTFPLTELAEQYAGPMLHPDETDAQFRARVTRDFGGHRCDLTCPDYREHMRAAGVDPDR